MPFVGIAPALARERADVQIDPKGVAAERLPYFKAMDRGFTPGYELDDWLAAEREVAALVTPTPKRRTTRGAATRKKS